MRDFRVVAIALVLAVILSGCFSYQPVSDWTGGTGYVAKAGVPVAGAKVSIKDKGGVLSAVTDNTGRFDVKVDSRKQLFLAMANPLKHYVTVVVEKDGLILKEWTFEKRVLGPNYFDFGTVDVTPSTRPNNSFKSTPLRGAA